MQEGDVDQSAQVFLNNAQVDAGYVLTCVAFPLGDLKIETHSEDEIYTLGSTD